MRSALILLFVACIAVPFAAFADHPRTTVNGGPTMLPVLGRIEVDGVAHQFRLSEEWRPTPTEQAALCFSSGAGNALLTITASAKGAPALPADAREFQRLIFPSFDDADPGQFFETASGLGGCNGFEFVYRLQGVRMRARAVIVPVPTGGHVRFVMTYTDDKAETFESGFGEALTSFHAIPDGVLPKTVPHLSSPNLISREDSRPPLESRPPAPITTEMLAARGEPVRPHASALPMEGNSMWFVWTLLGIVGFAGWLYRKKYVGHEQRTEAKASVRANASPTLVLVPDNAPIEPAAAEENIKKTEVGAALVHQRHLLGQIKDTNVLLRGAVQNLARASDDVDRTTVLNEILQHVSAIKGLSGDSQLRPVWQVSYSLEALVVHLLEKSGAGTSSVDRTIAGAVDLLDDLSVPDLNPSLAAEPPIRILAVDDDVLCRRAVTRALNQVFQTPDEALNGEAALLMATEKSYDVIFLDIEMPVMDGFTACSGIRNTVPNAETPIVFVTSHTDFNTRSQSRLQGGNDFISKPFMAQEIGLKALTYALRRRLKTNTVGALSDGDVANQKQPGSETAIATLAGAEQTSSSGMAGDGSPLGAAYISGALELFADASEAWPSSSITTQMEPVRTRVLTISARCRTAGLASRGRAAATVEALLTRMVQNPKVITPSVLATVKNALVLLKRIAETGADSVLADAGPVRLLVVDDEPLARRAVAGALQLAFEKPLMAEQGLAALSLASQKPFDAIFTDIEMPAMDGYELCRRIRMGGINQATPIVFITNHLNPEARAAATDCGATDFIGKPFLPIEITVKAVTLSIAARLDQCDRTKGALAATEIAA